MAIFNDSESKEEIFDLIDKFDKSNLFELEISTQSTKIKMMKLSQYNPDGPGVKVTVENFDGVENLELKKSNINRDSNNEAKIIKSPLIGTFYSSPSPESEPYVKVGDKVKKGMVICIVEAMKTMNEIESDTDGEIAEILVANGNVVEFGQPLFRLR